MRAHRPLLAILMVCAVTSHAYAAIFSDDEARKQIQIMSETVQNNQKSIIELNNQIELLKHENSVMRGQLETYERSLEDANTNQRSYYSELNDRLKRLEPQNLEIEGVKGTAQPGEKEAYDSALKAFQSNNMQKADAELTSFTRKYPSSPYWPLAQFWLANTKYFNKDYKGGILAADNLIKRFPEHPRVPDALLAKANCQLESGQKTAGKKTLEEIVKTYETSKAGAAAKKLLAAMK